jgi:tight adherence protein B
VTLASSLGGGLLIIFALVALAAGLAVYAIIRLAMREETGLQRALAAYEPGATAEDEEFKGREIQLSESAIVQRAIQVTGRIATDRGVMPKLERSLEKADLPLQPAEALFVYIASVALIGVASLFLLKKAPIMALAVILIVAILPWAALSFMAGHRQKKFTSQLPDMLQLLSGSLRAGFSLLQGVEAVSQEVGDPMGRELRRVLTEARLGRPLEEALDDAASRMESLDFEWAVTAIRIQREVGGNLAELLQTVAETMVARERLRREIKALTAEGRISAIVIGALPVGLGLIMFAINPEYMKVLFHDSFGQFMLVASTIWAAFGFWWMFKTIQIEV